MKTKATHDYKFPIGAWVCDPFMRRLSGGIEKDPVRGTVRFQPYAGEVIGFGELCRMLVYTVKFADSIGYVTADEAICYHCHTTDDASHHELCCDVWLRSQPHEPGYAA